ncbi:MAG: HutD family protein [Rudaea sp.]|nr:HutD family protein [Rudaea sp.]
MRARILRASGYRRMRWQNGGGWTLQLAVSPESAVQSGGAFDWRMSIADIESDGAFSTFANCERHIALLHGIGMELRFDSAPSVRLDRRLQFFRFAGEWQTHGRLISGPVRDFNVIVRRDTIAAEVWHRPLVGPMVFLAAPDTTWFVYLVAGNAAIKNRENLPTLDAGDSLLLEPDASPANIVLTGGGEVLIVKLVRRPAAVPA